MPQAYDVNDKDLSNVGKCFMIYSPFGCGKTSTFLTLPSRGLLISTEPRDPRVTLMASYPELYKEKAEKDEIKIMGVDGYHDAEQLLWKLHEAYEAGKRPYKSLMFDSMTYTQTEVKTQSVDERYEVRGKEKDKLLDRFKAERDEWTTIGEATLRITRLLNKFAKLYGMIVVATAPMTERVKFDRTLDAAPSFQGTMYNENYAGLFDYIGYATPNGSKFPPRIHFIEQDEDSDFYCGHFVQKCCSRTLREMELKHGSTPLDFRKILAAIEKDGE